MRGKSLRHRGAQSQAKVRSLSMSVNRTLVSKKQKPQTLTFDLSLSYISHLLAFMWITMVFDELDF